MAGILIAGCDSSDPNQLPTEKVSATVTYKGNPVEGATVSFMLPPSGGSNSGPPAFGVTDATGVAKLTTYKDGDGAILGKHMVLISKDEFQGTVEVASQDSEDYSPGATPPPKVKALLPKKYSLPTGGLSAEVVKGTPLEFTFDLKD